MRVLLDLDFSAISWTFKCFGKTGICCTYIYIYRCICMYVDKYVRVEKLEKYTQTEIAHIHMYMHTDILRYMTFKYIDVQT